MLVLTRKVGEEIVIGDNIRITVVEVGPGRVKIGIAAPRDVRIDRDEIRVKKEAECAVEVPVLHNRIAAQLVPSEPAPQTQLENRMKGIRPRLPRKTK
jgi:carbon storage regulator CsrA